MALPVRGLRDPTVLLSKRAQGPFQNLEGVVLAAQSQPDRVQTAPAGHEVLLHLGVGRQAGKRRQGGAAVASGGKRKDSDGFDFGRRRDELQVVPYAMPRGHRRLRRRRRRSLAHRHGPRLGAHALGCLVGVPVHVHALRPAADAPEARSVALETVLSDEAQGSDLAASGGHLTLLWTSPRDFGRMNDALKVIRAS